MIMKTKFLGRIKVINNLDIVYQNNMKVVIRQ